MLRLRVSMDSIDFLENLALIFFTAALFGFLATKLNAPVIVGYLLGGVLIGPYTLKLVPDVGTVQTVADVGVTLLMFGIGVEASLSELRTLRAVAVFGGMIQIILTMGLGMLVGLALHWDAYQALFLASVMAISSTAIVLKTLIDIGELDTQHGRISLGIMVVQDVAVVGLITLLITIRKAGAGVLPSVILSLLRAGVIITLALVFARVIFPFILSHVARLGSRELFTIALVALAIGASVGALSVGLVLSLGAFIAGLAVSGTQFRYQILATMLSVRDVFAALFFVAVGMLINPVFMIRNIGALGAVVAAIVIGKFLIGTIITLLYGFSGRVAFRVGASLVQIGEFSIVMAGIGLSRGLVSEYFYSITLAAALFTILITPLVMKSAGRIYGALCTVPFLRRYITGPAEHQVPHRAYSLIGHIIICGYGRVGRAVGMALLGFGKEFVAIDYDVRTVLQLRDDGIPAIYGDAGDQEILVQASPENARLAVIAVGDAISVRTAIRNLRLLSPRLHILARAVPGQSYGTLFEAGADEVFQTEFELGVEMMRHTLVHTGVPVEEVQDYVQNLRTNRYGPMEWVMGDLDT